MPRHKRNDRKKQRRLDAETRQETRNGISNTGQIRVLAGRSGESKRETLRLIGS
jgi:hypothetical protein